MKSSNLIQMLSERFPDKLDLTDESPFNRGKKAGVVELLRELNFYLKGEAVKKTVKL